MRFKKINTIIFVSLLILSAATQNKLRAQTTRYNMTNFNAWVALNGQFLITDKFGFHAEAQIRRNEGFSRWQQLLLRPGIFYNINPNLTATAGYAYVETYPYSEIPIAKVPFPEHRIWEQLQLTQKTGGVDITNRLRLEQRFFGDVNLGTFTNTRFENRFRYMFRVAVPLIKDANKVTKLYLPIYDEVMIAFGKNVKYNTFDQNRFGIGFGFNAGKGGKIEAGYMYQYVQQRNLLPNLQQPVENNHTLSITYYQSLRLFKKAK